MFYHVRCLHGQNGIWQIESSRDIGNTLCSFLSNPIALVLTLRFCYKSFFFGSFNIEQGHCTVIITMRAITAMFIVVKLENKSSKFEHRDFPCSYLATYSQSLLIQISLLDDITSNPLQFSIFGKSKQLSNKNRKKIWLAFIINPVILMQSFFSFGINIIVTFNFPVSFESY